MTINGVRVSDILAHKGIFYVQRQQLGRTAQYNIVNRLTGPVEVIGVGRQAEAQRICEKMNEEFRRQYEASKQQEA